MLVAKHYVINLYRVVAGSALNVRGRRDGIFEEKTAFGVIGRFAFQRQTYEREVSEFPS